MNACQALVEPGYNYLFVYLPTTSCVCCYVAVDDTRIILTDVDPSTPGSDYINANLIQVLYV